MKKIFFTVLIFIILSSGVTAGPISLMDSFSARSFSLAQADVAYKKGDLDSIFVNPAGLASLRGTSIGASYLPWFEDMQFISAGAAYSILSGGEFYGTIGLNVSIFSVPPFDNYDKDGGPLSKDVEVGDMLFNLGYGFSFIENFDIGFNIKFLNTTIGDSDDTGGLDFDFGILTFFNMPVIFGKDANKNFTLGLALKNINASPSKTRVGISYLFLNKNKINTVLLVEVNSTSDQNIKISSGIELGLLNLLKIRAGYNISADSGIGFSAGGGINYTLSKFNLALDYSMIPLQDFGVHHAISFKVSWGDTVKDRESLKNLSDMRNAYKNKQYAAAIKKIKEVLASDPSNAEALECQEKIYKRYLTTARNRMKDKKFKKALKYFQQYQKLNPDDRAIVSEILLLKSIVNDSQKPNIILNDFIGSDTFTVQEKEYTIKGKITDNKELKSIKINNIDADINTHKVVYKTKKGEIKERDLNVYKMTDKKIFFTLMKKGEVKNYSLPRTRITKITELKKISIEINQAVDLVEGENIFEIHVEDLKGNISKRTIKVILNTKIPEPEIESKTGEQEGEQETVQETNTLIE